MYVAPWIGSKKFHFFLLPSIFFCFLLFFYSSFYFFLLPSIFFCFLLFFLPLIDAISSLFQLPVDVGNMAVRVSSPLCGGDYLRETLDGEVRGSLSCEQHTKVRTMLYTTSCTSYPQRLVRCGPIRQCVWVCVCSTDVYIVYLFVTAT